MINYLVTEAPVKRAINYLFHSNIADKVEWENMN